MEDNATANQRGWSTHAVSSLRPASGRHAVGQERARENHVTLVLRPSFSKGGLAATCVTAACFLGLPITLLGTGNLGVPPLSPQDGRVFSYSSVPVTSSGMQDVMP